MATVQDLKRRIRSIRNTRKITKAMELVASARLRRAQARIEAMRPYADRMTELMTGTARAASSLQSLALLQRREVQKAAIAHEAAELYESGEVDRVILVYNQFVSALVQRVVERDVLPIPEEALERSVEEEREAALLGDFIYEPEPEEI